MHICFFIILNVISGKSMSFDFDYVEGGGGGWGSRTNPDKYDFTNSPRYLVVMMIMSRLDKLTTSGD